MLTVFYVNERALSGVERAMNILHKHQYINMKGIHQIVFLLFVCAVNMMAQNPIIRDHFSADPTARVFEGKMYLYPSHDIPSPIERLKEWFCMADYHVYSSDDLVDWTDHGVIVTQNRVPWVQPDSCSMWAPDCVYKLSLIHI